MKRRACVLAAALLCCHIGTPFKAQASDPAPLPDDLAACSGAHPDAAAMSPDMDFWAQQRFGANIFNHDPRKEDFQAAASLGIDFIRLGIGKWEGAEGAFLIGDPLNYTGLVKSDVARLLEVLDWAAEARMPIVLTMLRLPGAPWPQLDGDHVHQPLWRDHAYWRQSLRFWQDLAKALKSAKGVVAYNILNEPRPEEATGLTDFSTRSVLSWSDATQLSSADLSAFYRCMIDAIRAVDQGTPIMLEAGTYASANAFRYLAPVADPLTLYAVHSYFPINYTFEGRNRGRYEYPGLVRVWGRARFIDKLALRDHFAPLRAWTKDHQIAPERIVASELGVYRRAAGAPDYLSDMLDVVTDFGWHWSIYSFREDRWHEMDYELGAAELGSLSDDLDKRRAALVAQRVNAHDFATLWQRFKDGDE